MIMVAGVEAVVLVRGGVIDLALHPYRRTVDEASDPGVHCRIQQVACSLHVHPVEFVAVSVFSTVGGGDVVDPVDPGKLVSDLFAVLDVDDPTVDAHPHQGGGVVP